MPETSIERETSVARWVGGSFIVATAAGVVSLALQGPRLDSPDGVPSTILNTASLLEFMMAAAIVAIAVTIYPILKGLSERLAIGYVAARTVEAVAIAMDAMLLLTITTLQVDSSAPLRDLLISQRDTTGVGVTVAFVIGALILNYTLYKTHLVPRWLSGWGLVGILPYIVGGAITVYSLDPHSTIVVVLAVPLAIQEMALAVWLIVKGWSLPRGMGEGGATTQRHGEQQMLTRSDITIP